MSEYKNILRKRLDVLKTNYITTLTNIDRVEKDLTEAKSASLELLGAIKNIELILEQFNNIKELPVKATENIQPLRTPKVQSKKVKK